MPRIVQRSQIAELIQRRLPSQALTLLQHAAQLAHERSLPLYLVGGVVRDVLLGRETLDMDLVAEGDARSLAVALAHRLDGRAVTHDQFGTATFVSGGLRIDVAMARTERYPAPGALPEVAPGSIHDDLRRRDFTINAVACALLPEAFGRVVDPLGGRRDLQAGLVRVIHGQSFVDDPTRMLRAVRYQARFRFDAEEQTAALLRRDAPRLEAVSGDRVRHELERIFQEREPERALALAGGCGLLAAMHPSLQWHAGRARWFRRARRLGVASEHQYLCLLAHGLSEGDARALAQRLHLSNALARPLEDTARLRDKLPELGARRLRHSQVYDVLAPFDPEAVAACRIAAPSPIIGSRLRLYLEELRNVRPSLDGSDLLALGVPQGPQVGEVLAALRRVRLDGRVQSRDDEAAFVREWLARGEPRR
jgi:tRNA nucleotidyltransferase (CCA-adding enzyme)